MDNNKLKIFAQETRLKLIKLVKAKLQLVLTTDTAELRGREKDIHKLRERVSREGEDAVVEEMAYTWFNRIMALRFMDANGYNLPMVVTPVEGSNRPAILADALSGSIDENLNIPQSDIDDLLQGRTGDNHPQETLYRRLLIAKCNELGNVMPFLFEKLKDYTELLLPDDLLSELSFVTDIRNGMSDEDCLEHIQIVGWLYQFYITDRKQDAEKAKSRKGGLHSDEQAAATQLFTPDWIVCYMVENTLGRIWLTLHPDSPLRQQMKYYIAPVDNKQDPIPSHIQSVKDICFIDPCMGSGHVLVYAFVLFAQMYEEEGYQPKDIPNLIFENNLYGMDIDRRCYQLASFALTMAAGDYVGPRFFRRVETLKTPKVIVLQPIDHDVIASSGSWQDDSLVWQFEHIDTIGSLLKITPKECDAINVEKDSVFGLAQQKMKMQAEFLSKKYDCVVTNPPYLGKGIGEALKLYVNAQYPNSKADLMASFMEQCISLCQSNGRMSMINMQSWMFLSTFQRLREDILTSVQISSLLHLGPHTFDELSGEVVQNAAFVVSNQKYNSTGTYYRLVDGNNCTEKEQIFLCNIISNKNEKNKVKYDNVQQKDFFEVPGTPVGYWLSDNFKKLFRLPLMSEYATSHGQNITGNNDKYLRYLWEVNSNNINLNYWVLCARGGGFRRYYGNVQDVILWTDKARNYYKSDKIARIIIPKLRFKEGITWSYVCSNRPSFRKLSATELFEKAGTSIFIKDAKRRLNCILALLNSKISTIILNLVGPGTKKQVRDVFCVPVDNRIFNKDINKLESIQYALEKKDWDAHETSWDFSENPLVAIVKAATTADEDYQAATGSLQLAVKAFKDQWMDCFMQLHSNEEELNRQFIDIYGLQDELTPDVPLKEITILQNGEISIDDNNIIWHDNVLMKQLISYFIGCVMGRYAIEKPGLIIANQGETIDDFHKLVPEPKVKVDDDGIIPVLDGDYFPDDAMERIKNALRNVFGKENYNENIRYMEQALGKDIRSYLTKDFYKDHCKMYQKRPIYWMFASKKGTFQALVYMHRITPDTLSRLLANYVQPFIAMIESDKRQQDELHAREDITTKEKNRAQKLSDAYNKQLIELHDYEQQLMELASHRIAIDLDDGVKVNYAKYGDLVVKIK